MVVPPEVLILSSGAFGILTAKKNFVVHERKGSGEREAEDRAPQCLERAFLSCINFHRGATGTAVVMKEEEFTQRSKCEVVLFVVEGI